VESDQITNSGQVTTQDLTVNGTATGISAGVQLESGDSITVAAADGLLADGTFKSLFSGTAKDVLGGNVLAEVRSDWLFEFSDGSTLTKNSGAGGTTYTNTNLSRGRDSDGSAMEADSFVPAKDVVRIEVGAQSGTRDFAAEVILLD
jgi:hypothetical protein